MKPRNSQPKAKAATRSLTKAVRTGAKRPIKATIEHRFIYPEGNINKVHCGSEAVFVLPATPEAYEAMVEQGARGMSCQPHAGHMNDSWWAAYKRDYPTAWKSATVATESVLASLALNSPAHEAHH